MGQAMQWAKEAEQKKALAERLSRLGQNERAGLADFVRRLLLHYGDALRRVVLFGSKARGDADGESDLDLLIVVRMVSGDYQPYRDEIVDIAWQIESTYGLVTSLVIKSERDYAAMLRHQLLLARNIERDGIELWTTPQGALTLQLA